MKKIIGTGLLLLCVTVLQAQTVSQIGYIIKQAVTGVENIVVMVEKTQENRVKAEARTATLVTQKKYTVYTVATLGDMSKTFKTIQKMKNVVLLTIADNKILTPKSIKYAAQKMVLKKIPVVSTRETDTAQGALLTITKKGDELEKHLNLITAKALKLTLPQKFIDACIIDTQ